MLNEHFEGDGEIVFNHACKLGCEGIVSKRLGSFYRSGRSPHWVKVKNPGEARGGAGLGVLMRGPISEAVIIVILGFLIGGIPAAVIHFMIDSKWPSHATSLSGHPGASKAPLTSQ